jgi:hypothetical protein
MRTLAQSASSVAVRYVRRTFRQHSLLRDIRQKPDRGVSQRMQSVFPTPFGALSATQSIRARVEGVRVRRWMPNKLPGAYSSLRAEMLKHDVRGVIFPEPITAPFRLLNRHTFLAYLSQWYQGRTAILTCLTGYLEQRNLWGGSTCSFAP